MKSFFDIVRKRFGALSQSQVDGFNEVLRATASQPRSWRAYMLATVWHETAHTMKPIEEYGKGKGRPYGKPSGSYSKAYYGRGYVQLTWDYNYQTATTRLLKKGLIGKDINLLRNPELAMRPDIAGHILVLGMVEGWFTGRGLGDFGLRDYVGMRRIINGTDKASLIAAYAIHFEEALAASEKEAPAPVTPDPEKVILETAVNTLSPKPGFLSWVLSLFTRA